MDVGHPLVSASLRVVGVIVAALVIVAGFFDESVWYALGVGITIGVGFAVVAGLWDRLSA